MTVEPSDPARDFTIARDHVPEICDRLGVDEETRETALDLARKYDLHQEVSGRKPSGIAAGAVYIATLMKNEKRDQPEVADAAGVHWKTVSKSSRILRDLEWPTYDDEGESEGDDAADADGPVEIFTDRVREVLRR